MFRNVLIRFTLWKIIILSNVLSLEQTIYDGKWQGFQFISAIRSRCIDTCRFIFVVRYCVTFVQQYIDRL